jgi:hypothetical protein
MKALGLALALCGLALPACGQVSGVAAPEFLIDFSHPALSPSHWTLTLHPDGSGHFRSERGSATGQGSQGIDAPNVDRDIEVSAEFAEHVFETARRLKQSRSNCEDYPKVAFQGKKKLRLSGPDGEWGCEFNYSKDKEAQELGDNLTAVAETIVEGARLEVLLQHDRLGLDRQMEYLAASAVDGRAQQMGAIRGILEQLAEDSEVMERVRKRAKLLLGMAGNKDQGPGTEQK